MNPEIYSYVLPMLFEKGALDVYLTNIIMKKNRPGVKITILCLEEKANIFEDILFKETTTLGVRKYAIERSTLDRQFIKLDTKFGKATLKVALKDKEVLKYAPEYSECESLAKAFKVPIKDVYEEILLCAKKVKHLI